MRISIILAGALFITACATAPTEEEVRTEPTPEEIENADFGPAPDNPQELAEDLITQLLKDPESARFEHRDLFKGYAESRYPDASEESLREVKFGWIQCGTVNAKNSYGGYAGSEPFFVVINNDERVRFELGGDTDDTLYVYETCKNLVDD